MFFKKKFASNFVDVQKFKADLLSVYISTFFLDELRDVNTARERQNFMKKQSSEKPVKACPSPDSIMCFRKLQAYNLDENLQKFNVFKTSKILGNLKFYHFYKNDLRPKQTRDRYLVYPTTETSIVGKLATRRDEAVQQSNEPFHTANILMERQPHQCGFKLCEDLVKIDLREQIQSLKEELNIIGEGTIDKTLGILQTSPQRSRSSTDSTQNSCQKSPGKQVDYDDDQLDDTSIQDLFTDSPNLLKFEYKEPFIEKQFKNRSQMDLGGIKPQPLTEEDSDEGSVNEDKPESQAHSDQKKIGLFGMVTSGEEEDDLPREQRFSFIGKNLNKFNILEFVNSQEPKPK